ncbi:MAG TPA: sulfatase-like hydrolase/transferase, partial [Geminicoccaceae bacterium]|nr:sulfatase-like hydrolase/transferase [Geminicoccaceae bacterium]
MALGAFAVCGGAETARRPNIVVMLTDDQRWDAVGVVQRALGERGRFPWLRAATPNMDRIAAEGFRFRNAFTVSALCSPSRAAFLTGRYNHLNGVANNRTPFPLASVTYATLLRAAGYRTGYFGKWHMGTQRERPGFDRHASYLNQGRYFDAPFLVDGVPTSTTGWVDDVSTAYAADFIRRNAGRPFLVILGFKSPHRIPLPPPRLKDRFASTALASAPNAASYAPYDPSPEPAALSTEEIRDYFRTLVGVDQNVGRVLEALDEAGLTADTVVVFASDNGYFLGEHGIPGKVVPGDDDGNKRNAYEESLRIPALVRYPRLGRRGIVLGGSVLNIDLAPTLLELAGVPRPTSIQGRSWVPLLSGQSASVRDGFLYEYFYESGYVVPTIVALRRSRHKLVRYPGRPEWRELFDLATDSGETRNLVNDPESQD